MVDIGSGGSYRTVAPRPAGSGSVAPGADVIVTSVRFRTARKCHADAPLIGRRARGKAGRTQSSRGLLYGADALTQWRVGWQARGEPKKRLRGRIAWAAQLDAAKAARLERLFAQVDWAADAP